MNNSAMNANGAAEMTDEEWYLSLENDPRFAMINVKAEITACYDWCRSAGVRLTRRRVMEWIGDGEKTLDLPFARRPPTIDELYPKFTGYKR